MTTTNDDDRVTALQLDAASGISYRLRQPVPARPRKCVILLHGVGGNEMNLVDLAAGLHDETLLVFPQGPLQMGAQQFAWFRVMFTATGPHIEPQEAEHSRKALIQFVQNLQSRFGVDPSHTVIAGFSQGGILSASVALSSPESVAAFAVLSGRILPELEPQIADASRLKEMQAFIGHGQFDSKLPEVWAQRSDQLLHSLGVAHSSHRYPIDHAISAPMQADFLQWLAGVFQTPDAQTPGAPSISQV